LQAHNYLAENYATWLKQYPQAIAQYLRVIELERRAGKDVSPYYYEVGHCYFMMGDSRQALEVYERICRETPKGEYADSAAYQIGFLQFLAEDWEAAEKSFRFLLENYPDSEWTVDGMLQRARCLKELGRTAEFNSLCRTIRKRFPERAGDLDLQKPRKGHERRR
jgi:TolA-binding protein